MFNVEQKEKYYIYNVDSGIIKFSYYYEEIARKKVEELAKQSPNVKFQVLKIIVEVVNQATEWTDIRVVNY